MKILIAEHLSSDRVHLTQLIQQQPHCSVLTPCAKSGEETLKLVEQLKPDILFLNIKMPDLDGLQVAAQLCEKNDAPAIIFCVAHEAYPIQAFENNAINYLPKPVDSEHLKKALKHAKPVSPSQLLALARSSNLINTPRTHLSARTHKGIELTPIEQVVYFLADNKYVTLRHTQGETLLDESLKSLEKEFGQRFMRIHRNALVSCAHIKRLQRTPSGRYELHLHNVSEPLSVSRRHVALVRKRMDTL